MRPQKPRRGAHAALASAFAEIGERARGEAQLGMAEVAAFLSVSEGTLYKALDPDQAGEFSYVRARQVTEHYGCVALAEDMAHAAGGVFTRLPEPQVGGEAWQRTIREILTDMQVVIADLSTALENDNDVSAQEVVTLRMREHIARAVTDLVAHDLHLKAIARAGS
ncbi:phage regulatory CII family protein [Jiella marina]|uniref:phage regulatory CII family protein n=1 Tax=Jiella sp. LLJ827 TaxID=2917712 RepID=UPI00210086DF|nr:phage regulatory CII family protein [Jiella sp. LLJ827]MCQ0987527.1 hypothetical protein [Jiella sp. LLJ827]